jgi:uncharacterized protein (DUF1499 family)
MRIFILIVVVLGLLAAVALAVYMRQYPMSAERWHVDPAAVAPREGSRNSYLSRGQDAPRLTGTPLEVAMRLDQAAKEDRAVLIAGDPASGHMTYVARSRVFGFPDAVSIRLHEEGDATRVDVFSRSAVGDYDWGEPGPRHALDRLRRSVSAPAP